MSSGKLFHSFGPTEANDRSPTVTRRDGRTVSWLEVDARGHVGNAAEPIRLVPRRSPVKSSVDDDCQPERDCCDGAAPSWWLK